MRKLYGYLTGHRERGARTLPLNQQYWASSGSTSSKTGGWYLSLLRAAFRYFGSMKTSKAPEFFEAVARLLTQGVGSSIGASAASFTYLSNSCFSLDFSPAGTLRFRNYQGAGVVLGLQVYCCWESSQLAAEEVFIFFYNFLYHALFSPFLTNNGEVVSALTLLTLFSPGGGLPFNHVVFI